MTPQDTMRLALGALESLQRYDGTLTGAQVATAIESLREALAQQGEQPVAWPQTPEQISDFIGSNFVWREGNDVAPKYGDKYCVTAHDLLSAFREWPEFAAAPAAQPTVEAAHELGAKGAEPTEAERLLFEAWMRGHCWGVVGEWDGKTYKHADEVGGWPHPGAVNTRQLWAVWRDRAALAAPATQPDTWTDDGGWTFPVERQIIQTR